MRIACLAWGSLVWKPDKLQITLPWYFDGPQVPVEFARQSQGNRLTLVIGEGFQKNPSLYAWMKTTILSEAIENLRAREDTTTTRIGTWQIGEVAPERIPDLPSWAKDKGATAVIWTALPPKFQNENSRVPTIEEALEFLQSLNPEKQKSAEEYIRKAPKQVRTPYREKFEAHFGWYPD